MRDPLEAQHWPEPSTFWVSPDEPEQQDERELARLGVVVAAKAAARLLSLTADATDYGEETEPFGRGYARASMWQLYGDDHQGVCLAFDRERLLSALRSGLADSARIMAKPVQYVRGLTPDSLPPSL